jgi:SAM-dependent methyltransferase
MSKKNKYKDCPICKQKGLKSKFTYKKPPKNEIDFGINQEKYFREYLKCKICGHFYSTVDNFNPEILYKGNFNNSIYMENFNKTFLKIIKLPKEKSDNFYRVKKIENFCKEFFKDYNKVSLLDVGSGLGVFPYAIKKKGLKINCIDPDQKSVDHLNYKLKIKAFCGNFLEIRNKKKYNIVTFNKVLEHVKNPYLMLNHTKNFLKKNSIVYIELPDGEMASISRKGKFCEEFFIDHIHVFSATSLSHLIKNSGFKLISMSRYIEPSNKITISAFCKI